MSTRRWAHTLATGATCTALSLSVLSGLQRGASLPERLVWVALGLVLVISAHLLPALLGDAPARVRALGGVLWAMCMATACVGHAVFFVAAQQHARERRVLALPAMPASSPSRSLTAVMAERATVTAQLAAANARYCARNCVTMQGRRAALSARIDALNAEAEDIRRRQVSEDRVTARRDALRADPVTSRLAALLGVSASRIDLLFGVLFAAVLEGVACLLWTVALKSPLPTATEASASAVADAAHATLPVVATIMASQIDGATNRGSVSVSRGNTGQSTVGIKSPIGAVAGCEAVIRHRVGSTIDRGQASRAVGPSTTRDLQSDFTQLAMDVAAGRVRPTVADIRRHLGCSQAKATALRRQLAEATSNA